MLRIILVAVPAFNRVEPRPEPMTTDTIFDMVSLNKPVATATGVMQLIESGLIRLDAQASEYLPEFGTEGKKEITVRQLLIHTSGLIPDNPLSDYGNGPEIAWQKICDLKPQTPPGTAFKYSDVNFIVLGKLIERKSGQTLDQYLQNKTLEPLGMVDSGFGVPLDRRHRCAPTERRDGEWIVGTVHDPRAWALAGVAGHAGLFSTLDDLRKYAQAMLLLSIHPPSDDPPNWLQPGTVRLMTGANRVPGGVRGLGWDKQTGFSSNRGDLLSPRAFGHGGPNTSSPSSWESMCPGRCWTLAPNRLSDTTPYRFGME
jgi:CubicO group peptidase (beta-lactamase class C family)